jgi:YaiO family outer membrane protein
VRPLFAAALLLAGTLAVPASAQEQNGYEAGVAARQAGRAAEAQRLLQAWLATHPEDADARLQLAYAELALGNLDAAEEGFAAVLRQAPDYLDAREGLAAVAARRAGERRSSIALVGALSDLGAGARGWSEVALDAEFATGATTTLGGGATYFRRFGLDDVEFVARAGIHPSENLWLRGLMGGTPHADIRPRFELGAGADLRISGGDATVLTLDGAYQRFPLQDVLSVNPGLIQYVANGRAWVTLRGIGVVSDSGPLEVGGLLRVDYVPAPEWRVFGGVSNGPDTDLGVVTRVTGLFGGAEAPLGRKLGVTGSVTREWRDGGFDRTEFRLGLKAHF